MVWLPISLPSREDPAHRASRPGISWPISKKVAVDVLSAQHVEEAGGVFAGPVVEGEGDDLAVARAVADQAAAAARAADRAHRPQAEDAVGRLPGRSRRIGAPARAQLPRPSSARQR